MRFAAVDAVTGGIAKMEFKDLPPGSSPPREGGGEEEGEIGGGGGGGGKALVNWMWVPRIKCHDCPQKLYTAVPEDTAGKFEVHLANSKHRAAVRERVGG